MRRRRQMGLVAHAARRVEAHRPRREVGLQVRGEVPRGAVVAGDDQRRPLRVRVEQRREQVRPQAGRHEGALRRLVRLGDELLDGIVVLCVCEKRPEHALRPPGGAARLYSSEVTRRSTASAARFDQLARVLRRTGRGRSAETISGSVLSGRPTPTRTASELAAPQALLQRFQPVVAREPASGADLDLPERQVDLVMTDEHMVEIHAQRSARRAQRSFPTRSCTSAAAETRRRLPSA